MTMDEQFDDIRKQMTEMEARLVETMRNMQTEVPRGMAAYSSSVTLRIRKVEVDQSNLDAALSGRVEIQRSRK